MEEILADLSYISKYALEARREIQRDGEPTPYYLLRLRELAEKVEKHFDKNPT